MNKRDIFCVLLQSITYLEMLANKVSDELSIEY